jgi:hypothetical protein
MLLVQTVPHEDAGCGVFDESKQEDIKAAVSFVMGGYLHNSNDVYVKIYLMHKDKHSETCADSGTVDNCTWLKSIKSVQAQKVALHEIVEFAESWAGVLSDFEQQD